ncbi:MAG: hypothetical protein HUU21_06275 [Polyangiaceae bacterium]|nr:DUF3467 domain-containing protein [Polyangiaceae bacterium]NUQ73142.1 hypothetical protein [Polyangiaceae bacterium]
MDTKPHEIYLEFDVADQLPSYVNNARIEVTDDNVYIDFGMTDPFLLSGAPRKVTSKARARVVMNKSTFLTLADHIQGIRDALTAPAASLAAGAPAEPSIIVMSRCPPKVTKE